MVNQQHPQMPQKNDFDQLVATMTRRRFGLVGGGLAGALLSLVLPGSGQAKVSKKTKKRCKKDSKQCKSAATQYCTSNYDSPQREQCVTEIHRCCSFYAKCSKKNYKKGDACNAAVPW